MFIGHVKDRHSNPDFFGCNNIQLDSQFLLLHTIADKTINIVADSCKYRQQYSHWADYLIFHSHMFLPVKQLKKSRASGFLRVTWDRIYLTKVCTCLHQTSVHPLLRLKAANSDIQIQNRVKNNRIWSFLTKQISFMDFLLRRNLHTAECGTKALGTWRHN